MNLMIDLERRIQATAEAGRATLSPLQMLFDKSVFEVTGKIPNSVQKFSFLKTRGNPATITTPNGTAGIVTIAETYSTIDYLRHRQVMRFDEGQIEAMEANGIRSESENQVSFDVLWDMYRDRDEYLMGLLALVHSNQDSRTDSGRYYKNGLFSPNQAGVKHLDDVNISEINETTAMVITRSILELVRSVNTDAIPITDIAMPQKLWETLVILSNTHASSLASLETALRGVVIRPMTMLDDSNILLAYNRSSSYFRIVNGSDPKLIRANDIYKEGGVLVYEAVFDSIIGGLVFQRENLFAMRKIILP